MRCKIETFRRRSGLLRTKKWFAAAGQTKKWFPAGESARPSRPSAAPPPRRAAAPRPPPPHRRRHARHQPRSPPPPPSPPSLRPPPSPPPPPTAAAALARLLGLQQRSSPRPARPVRPPAAPVHALCRPAPSQLRRWRRSCRPFCQLTHDYRMPSRAAHLCTPQLLSHGRLWLWI
jgi:hypothetical protein